MRHTIRFVVFTLSYLLLCLFAVAPLHAQQYRVKSFPTLAIDNVTASTASNATTIAASGGFAPTFYRIPNPNAAFDVAVNFTCNTQVFWGATFVFAGSPDGTNANTFGGAYLTTAQCYPQTFKLICATNTTSVSNYVATFRSTDTNDCARAVSWGPYIGFLGCTNIAPTTLTINGITVGQVQ